MNEFPHLMVDGTTKRKVEHFDSSSFLTDLVNNFQLGLLSGPWEYYQKGAGFHAYVILTTSHSYVHAMDNGDIFVDIFSCKKLDEIKLVDFVNQWWEMKESRFTRILRGGR